jgi:hypothetical protein
MRKVVALAVLFSAVALGQNAPNVLTPGTPSRPVWVTGTVSVNAISLTLDGGSINVTVPSTSVVDAGSVPNNVGTVIMGNNNGHMMVPQLDDAGSFIMNQGTSNQGGTAWKIYFDGGVVSQGAGVNGTPWLVYFDGGVVTSNQGAAAPTTPWAVYFDGGTVTVQGLAATNTSVTNPIVVGTRAVSDSAAPTAVTAANQGSAIGDLYGRPMVQTFHPNHWSCNINQDAGITLCETAPGSNLSLYITDVALSTNAADTVALTSGASNVCDGGTVTTVLGSLFMAQSSGGDHTFSSNFQTPLKVPANTALCCSASVATTCNISGFIAP